MVDSIINKIETKFGKMSQTRGDKHEFLGMDITYHDRKVSISMKKHIEKAIDSFEEDITREAALPVMNPCSKSEMCQRLTRGGPRIFIA